MIQLQVLVVFVLLLFLVLLFESLECIGGHGVQSDERLEWASSSIGISNDASLVNVTTSQKLTLLGSLTSTYLPSGCFIQRSMIILTIPQPLASETAI